MHLKDTSKGLPGFGLGISGLTISIIFAAYIAVNYGFAIDLFSMVVPDMKKDLGLSYTTVGNISACVRGGFLAASLLTMYLVQWVGAGRLVYLSVAICTACFWGLTLANSAWVVGSLMTLIGACAASVYIPMVGVVGRFVAKKYHGRVIGFICGGQSLGVIGASWLVPYAITHHTWRQAWTTVGIIGVATLVLTCLPLWKIRVFESTPESDESGTAEGASLGKEAGVPWAKGTYLILILYFLSAFSFNPFQTYLSPYLRGELGFSVEAAAGVWSLIALPGVVSGLFMGYLADRLGISVSLVVAYGATLVATLILLLAPHSHAMALGSLLFGIAFYSIFGLIPAYISKVNSPAVAVKVFALANIAHGAGGISGNFFGGRSKDILGTFQWLYALIAMVLVGLIILSLILPKEKERESNTGLLQNAEI